MGWDPCRIMAVDDLYRKKLAFEIVRCLKELRGLAFRPNHQNSVQTTSHCDYSMTIYEVDACIQLMTKDELKSFVDRYIDLIKFCADKSEQEITTRENEFKDLEILVSRREAEVYKKNLELHKEKLSTYESIVTEELKRRKNDILRRKVNSTTSKNLMNSVNWVFSVTKIC